MVTRGQVSHLSKKGAVAVDAGEGWAGSRRAPAREGRRGRAARRRPTLLQTAFSPCSRSSDSWGLPRYCCSSAWRTRMEKGTMEPAIGARAVSPPARAPRASPGPGPFVSR